MFVWYEKETTEGKPPAATVLRNVIICILLAAIISGVIFYFSNSKDIISIEQLQQLAFSQEMEFHANDEDTATITKDGIILSIIQCQTAAEASQRFE